MAVALLDVNVLVAMFEPFHTYHAVAQAWFQQESPRWATCPITVLGLIRILTNPAYPQAQTAPEIARRLRHVCTGSAHQFWPADIGGADEAHLDLQAIQGHRQLTDVYLLALTVKNGGELVTFDRTIPWRAVRGAKASHLRVLGG